MPKAVMKAKAVARSPSAAVAKARKSLAKRKKDVKLRAAAVEAKVRAKGGYGKAMVSPWEIPKGGIMASPAYKKMVGRCGCTGSKPPPPKERDGAPLKGGYPLDKYPPNVLVDGQRASWLPDDWAQVVKNTGPGGVYLGWLSPEGKFFYHRRGYPSAIEESLGRKLSAKDGFNGVLRTCSRRVPPGADAEFLKKTLTKEEQKHVLDKSKFHFGVISARRATSDDGQYSCMLVEGLFRGAGVKPIWYVDADSLEDYRALGLNAVVGGKLTPARNLALDEAKKRGQICVQVSDDISKWEYYDCAKQDFRGEVDFSKANAAASGSRKYCVSPVAAAQWMLAKMRSDPLKPHLGGVHPTANAAMALGQEEYSYHHFILGDFFVAEPKSACRFDTKMTLKEDYDYTCSHIKAHGSVLRCNRIFLTVKHSTNAGGAVATRDNAGSKERENIAILQKKWPGVFYMNGKRQDEVIMKWGGAKKDASASGAAEKPKAAAKKVVGKLSSFAKRTVKKFGDYKPTWKVKFIGACDSKVAYINKRCKAVSGKTIEACLGATYTDEKGQSRNYGLSDLKYDVGGGRLTIVK